MLTGPDLFRVIADQLEAHPEKYDQGTWGVDDTKEISEHDFFTVAERMAVNGCGTRGCIAGWAAAFNITAPQVAEPIRSGVYDISKIAAELLELPQSQANELFDEHWKPRRDLTVSEALRKLANGATVDSVSGWDDDDDEEGDDDDYDY